MKMVWILTRFTRFRAELALLWRAFRDPLVPLHLKGLMLLVPLYLVSPIDLIPDIIPVVGWLDDLVIVPSLVGFISRLVAAHGERSGRARPRGEHTEGTIEGRWRRL